LGTLWIPHRGRKGETEPGVVPAFTVTNPRKACVRLQKQASTRSIAQSSQAAGPGRARKYCDSGESRPPPTRERKSYDPK